MFGLKLGDDGDKRCVGGGKIAQFGGDVAVVPAVKVDPNFLKKFKGDARLPSFLTRMQVKLP